MKAKAMKAKAITKTISLWEVDAYFERHNLVIRPTSFDWQRDEKTGLETPHVEAAKVNGPTKTQAN